MVIFNYLFMFYNYFRYLMAFVFFTFIYKYFFNKCYRETEKIKESTKNPNKKKIVKVREKKISLAFIYFFIITILYLIMDYKTFICLFLIVILSLLLIINKIDDTMINFNFLDKTLVMRGLWFVFSNIFLFLFFIFKPFYAYIEKNKKSNNDLINGTLKNIMKNTPYAGIVDFILGSDTGSNNGSGSGIGSGKMGDALNLFDNINHLKRLVDIEAKISSEEIKNSKPISSDNIDKYILTNKKDNNIQVRSNTSNVVNRKNKNNSDSSDLLNYLIKISSSIENNNGILGLDSNNNDYDNSNFDETSVSKIKDFSKFELSESFLKSHSAEFTKNKPKNIIINNLNSSSENSLKSSENSENINKDSLEETVNNDNLEEETVNNDNLEEEMTNNNLEEETVNNDNLEEETTNGNIESNLNTISIDDVSFDKKSDEDTIPLVSNIDN